MLLYMIVKSQPVNINTYQKCFELAMFWKELSYNFANLNNNNVLNIDSLYLAYIPRVSETKNDFEYYLEMQSFAAHFKNGHTFCSLPQNLIPHLCTTTLRTEFDNGKVYLKNVGLHSKGANNVKVGDEILKINGLPAVEYFSRFGVPYVSCTNQENKIQESMFSIYNQCPNKYALVSENRTLTLDVLTDNGIRQLIVDFDIFLDPNEQQKEFQSNIQWLDTNSQSDKRLDFMLIPEEKAAYIRLDESNEKTADLFLSHWPQIANQKHLIIDLRENPGGDGNAYSSIIPYLIIDDTIGYGWFGLGKIHNSAKKAWGMSKQLFYEEEDVDEWYKQNYYPYVYGTAFDTVMTPSYYPNTLPASERFKGKISVLVGPHTASAAEGFVITLSQSHNVTLFGKKTAGATGQPLVIPLKSGIYLFISSFKSLDLYGRDISSGIEPDIHMDFDKDDVIKITKKIP